MGASAALMAFCTSWIVANIGLLLGAALTGVLAIASSEAGTRKPAAKTISVRRDKLRRWRGARCGTVYLGIVVTSLYGLIVAWCCEGNYMGIMTHITHWVKHMTMHSKGL